MAMQQMARRMASRVFPTGTRRPPLSGTHYGASSRRFFCSSRRFFCSKEESRELLSSLPPRRESIWAEIKEWRLVGQHASSEEKLVVASGTVVLSIIVGSTGLGALYVLFRREWFINHLEARKKKRLEEARSS